MTIKASDLRIGNWMQNNFGINYQVTAAILLEFQNFGVKDKPIPLTEEWIDKLSDEEYAFEGFCSRIICKCIKFPAIKYEFSSECVLVYFQGELINRVDYVHEWQNIHHALTREELTINN